jgi:hypothetical protein
MRVNPRRWTLSVCAAGLMATAGLTLDAGAADTRTATVTLHYFAKSESEALTNVFGQPETTEAAHDQFVATDLYYLGTHSRHAKSWTGSDHEFCSFTTISSATCFGEIAIGGSLLYVDNFTLNKSSTGSEAISGGTGQFFHDTGTIAMKTVGTTQNDDVTIVLHTT